MTTTHQPTVTDWRLRKAKVLLGIANRLREERGQVLTQSDADDLVVRGLLVVLARQTDSNAPKGRWDNDPSEDTWAIFKSMLPLDEPPTITDPFDGLGAVGF